MGTKYQAVFVGNDGGEVLFPGVSFWSGPVKEHAAYTLAGGTIIASNTFTLAFLEHEYGHYLDELKNGSYYYIFKVIPSSLSNEIFSPETHRSYWTEIQANQNAVQFFGPDSAIANNPERFPVK